MSKKPNIGIDIRMYAMAGIGRYLQNLLPDLIPRVNASKIWIFGKASDVSGANWLNDPRIEFCDFNAPIFSAEEQLVAATGRYREVDLLWMPQYNLPLLYGKKLLVTVHDLCQLAHPDTLGSDLQRGYARFLLSRVARRASKIMCVSEFTASEIRRYLNVNQERLVITYPAISETWHSFTEQATKRCTPPFLLAVGNLKKHKNLPRLVAAFEHIQGLIPHRLVIVGKRDGFLNAEVGFGSSSGRVGERIQFTGPVDDQKLQSYYRGASALIFPSYYEGFGYPLVEAMTQGCPIACSNVAALPEVAGDAALYFDPFSVEEIGTGLLRIATDGRLQSALAERGRERIRRFIGTTCAELTSQTINRLLEE
jgi:glycosyltransferase involved in cell wall biosynthesis